MLKFYTHSVNIFYSINRGFGQSTLQNFAKCIFRPEKTLSTENASPRGSSFQSSRLRTFIFRLRVFSALNLLSRTFYVRVKVGGVVVCKALDGNCPRTAVIHFVRQCSGVSILVYALCNIFFLQIFFKPIFFLHLVYFCKLFAFEEKGLFGYYLFSGVPYS